MNNEEVLQFREALLDEVARNAEANNELKYTKEIKDVILAQASKATSRYNKTQNKNIY